MYKLIQPLLFSMNPETTHHLVLDVLHAMPKAARLATPRVQAPASLQQTLWGQTFHHPIGLAAGLDKNAYAVDGLFQCGFAFVEVGTVTPQPQPGNPSPRLFRLKTDLALINRMGFNNEGVEQLCRNLAQRRGPGIVGINIGKNKVTPNDHAIDDYLKCLDVALPFADYIVLNVSSPNTPGLRDLQSERTLLPLLQAVLERRNAFAARLPVGGHDNSTSPPMRSTPILVKLAPDLTDDAVIALGQAMLEAGVDGFIATNTTIARDGLRSREASESGGLSGQPLGARATAVIRLLYAVTRGRIPIIASGGVMNPDDAWEKICAGANLVQVYTGFIYRGPRIVHDIVQALPRQLARHGYPNIAAAVGSQVT